MPAELQRLSRKGSKAPGIGIVHLGLGAFFRAHGAIYVEEAMEASSGDWGIVGVSLMSPGQRDALKPQDCLYHAVEQGPRGERARLVRSVVDILVARESPSAVIGLMSDPRIRIVSLTVTEKGYCHEPATGQLRPDHPDIVHDLGHDLPVTAPGFLVRALAARRQAGLPPFTVLTCDNLPDNGAVVRKVVLDFATRVDPSLARWIERECRFPATMVDRIVPATKPEDVARVAGLTGFSDTAPVMHEPFRQWVVEDDFVGGDRPDLAAVGVELVTRVQPYEHMKLRMLNGTHSALAYLGYLAGHETISATVADPVFAGYVKGLWPREIIPSLVPPEGVDLQAYAGRLFERYANPAIRHRTWQIAMDGSQKLPQRIVGTIESAIIANRPWPGLALAIAAWIRYVGGIDERGDPIDVRDPMAARLKAALDTAQGSAQKVAAALAFREIFNESFAMRAGPAVIAAHERLASVGARQAAGELA